jgi:hypothetical protein
MLKFTNLVCILLMLSCSENQKEIEKEGVSFYCFIESDTVLYIKIENKTQNDIFLPGRYFGCYTLNDDSLHLEAFENPKYNTSLFYRYKNLFSFPVLTTQEITNVNADSTFEITNHISYNQFQVRPFSVLKKGLSKEIRINFNIPISTKSVSVVFYRKDFLKEWSGKNRAYEMNDFIMFEKNNGEYLFTKPYFKARM